jgi:hypothetical protein
MLYPDDVMSGGGTVGGRWYLKRHQNGEFQNRKLQNGNLKIDFSFCRIAIFWRPSFLKLAKIIEILS